jgi:hypothetical protein
MTLLDLFRTSSPNRSSGRRRHARRPPQAAEVLEERILLTPSPTKPEDITGFQAGRWVTSLGTTNRSGAVTSQWDTFSNIAWNFVGEGDFNGDGLTDVIGFYKGTWYVGLSTGSSFNHLLNGVSHAWAQWNPAVSWQDIRIADLNGDGLSDIFGRAGTSFWAALSNGASFNGASLWGTTGGLNYSALLLADVGTPAGPADGNADILVFTTGGNWVVGYSTGAQFTNGSVWAVWDVTTPWQGLTAADMNGDGLADVVGFRAGRWRVGVSTGTAFGTVQWAVWAQAAWQDARVGDFDGNGVGDIAARLSGQWWVGLGSLPSGTLVVNTSYFGAWSNAVTWQDVRVGDFDGDGRDDIAGRYLNQWYVGFTTADSAGKTGLLFHNLAFANWSAWDSGGTWLAVATVQANNLPAVQGAVATQPVGDSEAALSAATIPQQKDSLLSFWARAPWDDELERSLYGV